jgi:hypothetical protein
MSAEAVGLHQDIVAVLERRLRGFTGVAAAAGAGTALCLAGAYRTGNDVVVQTADSRRAGWVAELAVRSGHPTPGLITVEPHPPLGDTVSIPDPHRWWCDRVGVGFDEAIRRATRLSVGHHMPAAVGAWTAALLVGRPAVTAAQLSLPVPTPGVGMVLVGLALRLGVRANLREVLAGPQVVIRRSRRDEAHPVLQMCEALGVDKPEVAWLPEAEVKAFGTANTELARRAGHAAAEMCCAAIAAGYEVPESVAEVVRLRIAHPALSLADLGRCMQPPMSKNTVQGRLRRFIRAIRAAQYAGRGQWPPGLAEPIELEGAC